jgi:hypothetical protein
MSNESNNPLGRQVGGTHYADMAIQPFAYIHANGIGFAEGCAIKYLSRWRAKGGIEDLRKARHFVDMLIEAETPATERQDMRSTAFVRPHQEDAEWPKVGDVCFTWAINATGGTYQTTWRDSSAVLSGWMEDGALFRTEAEALAEWHKRYGKKEEPVASAPELLNADEMALVAGQKHITATVALSECTGLSLVSAKRIVDAYRASIKASEPPPEHVAIKPPCPTGVPENGEWMPEDSEIYWDAADGESWPWCGCPALDLQSLEDGDVCRTREIARTVQRRRKAAAKGGAE